MSYNTSSTKSETYYDERTYEVSVYRDLPYGYDRKQLVNLSNYMTNVCLIPYGGILNTSSNGADSFTARVSLNMNKSFNDVHSVSFMAVLTCKVKNQKATRKKNGDIYRNGGRTSCLLIN